MIEGEGWGVPFASFRRRVFGRLGRGSNVKPNLSPKGHDAAR